MEDRKRPDIVSMHLSDEAKKQLDDVCDTRGMTIKMLLGKLIEWFNRLDRTEQSIVLSQVEAADVLGLAEMVLQRRNAKGSSKTRKSR